MKITCKHCIGFASKILLVASLFIFTSVVLAQTNVYVGDEEVVIEPETTGTEMQQDDQIDTETPTSTNVQEVPVTQPTPAPASTTQVQTIETAPEEAPDSGPKEALIISISVLVGLAVATYFLFKNIKKYNS